MIVIPKCLETWLAQCVKQIWIQKFLSGIPKKKTFQLKSKTVSMLEKDLILVCSPKCICTVIYVLYTSLVKKSWWVKDFFCECGRGASSKPTCKVFHVPPTTTIWHLLEMVFFCVQLFSAVLGRLNMICDVNRILTLLS